MPGLLDTTYNLENYFLKYEQLFDNIRTYKANGGKRHVT